MMNDNQGLLTCIGSSLPYFKPFLNVTLGLEWDITNKIPHSLCTLVIPSLLHHVKGHQDSKIPYDHLPLNTQLKMDANAEAGYYQ